MKQHFEITGMTCAACKARVDKAANSVDGVGEVAVNLLKNSMEVECDGSPETIAAIIEAVEKAGYGASARIEASAANAAAAASTNVSEIKQRQNDSERAAEKAQKSMLHRLIVSIIFTVPLFYLSMGMMYGWPLPPCFTGMENILALAFTELLLLIPTIVVNLQYFTSGFKSLFHGAPNMNSLIALGATASTCYGVYGIYMMCYYAGQLDLMSAHMQAMDLYFESAGMILTLITLGKYFESRAKGRTTSAISKLMDLSPKRAIRVEDGVEVEIPVEQVRVGDILVVKAGQGVPVDGRIVEGAASVDESAITGESIPVEKGEGDQVIGATVSKSGWFKMEAERVGDDTAIAGIAKMVDEATSTKAPIEKFADKVSSIFVPVVIAIAIVTFIIWMLIGGGFATALDRAITVLVISCPCALGLATPTAIMVGTGRGATNGILVKSADSLQRTRDIKTVIFDKTGTLTEGRPRVTSVEPEEGIDVEDLLTVAYSLEKLSEHPLASAVCEYVDEHEDEYDIFPIEVEDFEQSGGLGIAGTLDGKRCMAGNIRMLEENGIDLGDAQERVDAMADLGRTPLLFTCDGQFIGMITEADTIKPSSRHAVEELRAMGIKTMMLTGDTVRTAVAVQAQCNVDEVVAGVLPGDKAEVVRRASEEGGVAMVGDGINDAPALATANVGIAIGAGTDIAMETADMVLMASDLMAVPAGIQLSRATMRNIKQNLFWALFYNACCIPLAAGVLAFAGVEFGPDFAAAAMSLSSICVVSNALRLRAWKPKLAYPDADTAAAAPAVVAKVTDAKEMPVLPAAGTEDGSEAEAAEPEPVEATSAKMLSVEGMHCEKCVGRVTAALGSIDAVVYADVSLEKNRAIVRLSEYVADDVLVAAVEELGFTAAPLPLGIRFVFVEGMHCGKCVARVTAALEALDGVALANVSLDEKLATVALSDLVTDDMLVSAVTELGFEAAVLKPRAKALSVDGMHCQKCVKRVTEALLALGGVGHAVVSLEKNRAVVRLYEFVADDVLVAAVEELGFTAAPLPLGVRFVFVEGMHCGKCVARVTAALEALDGVALANVSLDEKLATVALADAVADEVLVSAVTELGFEAAVLEPQAKALSVDGMHCQKCVKRVTEALLALGGVGHVVVSLDEKRADLMLTAEVPDDVLVSAVTELGFEAAVL